jgi:uncharacterized protein YkwD
VQYAIIIFLSINVFGWSFLGLGATTQEKPVEVRTVLPMDIGYEKSKAYMYLNEIREAMGLNTLVENSQLSLAAQYHCDYLVANELSSHYESEGLKKFVGVRPLDRSLYAGYNSRFVSENLSTHTYGAQESIDGLFSAIYHRFGFLSQSIDEVGVGVAQEKQKTSNSAFVYVMSNSNITRLCNEKSSTRSGTYYYDICKDTSHRITQKKYLMAERLNKAYNPKIILYPYDRQTQVPPAFYDETPDPLPHHDVSGFPVSIEFNDYYFSKVKLESFRLFNEEGVEIKKVLLMDKENDPHARFTDKQFALFPLKRLEYHTRYRAEVSYRSKEKTEHITWHFTTTKPQEIFHRLEGENIEVHLQKGMNHILYIVPENPQDIWKHIQFPSNVDVVFLDQNTLKITLLTEDLDDFMIISKRHKIHAIVD